ncbi:MAG: UDP-N-acetylglucosamine--N-acetylmuramyl-(pentapeptide) pyrophosphoryl-undecaprenol N-acetylglucosamine transferase, partial [Candidatus Syntrophonatronum acetioxidans]
PGVTNKILSKFANKVCVSFEASKKYFRDLDKVEVTGNPRAYEVLGSSREEGIKYLGLNPNKATVLIVGGSRGAEVINQNALKMLPHLSKISHAQFVYVTGQVYYDKVVDYIKKRENLGLDNIIIKPYLVEMPLALSAADLVISRAGATTLAEITVLGIPSILIPSPNVTNNHQYLNAKVLSEGGAAELVNEEDLTPSLLVNKIIELIENKKRLYEMSLCSEKLSYPDSTRTIFRLLKDIAK